MDNNSKLVLGHLVRSEIIGGHWTPSTILANGFTFTWDEEQGYYSHHSMDLYLEGEDLTAESYYEVTAL